MTGVTIIITVIVVAFVVVIILDPRKNDCRKN